MAALPAARCIGRRTDQSVGFELGEGAIDTGPVDAADLQSVHALGEAVAVARFLGQQEEDGGEQEVARGGDFEPRVPARLHAGGRGIVFDHGYPQVAPIGSFL